MIFEEIIEKYNSFPEVVAIAVGGSGANKTSDVLSDIDLYVFVEKDIPISCRNELFHPGEKRLIQYAKNNCNILPKDFEENINQLLISSKDNPIFILDNIYTNLKDIL